MTKQKHKAPGKHYRKGMTLSQLADMFPNDQAAEEWFIKQRWPNEICCITADRFELATSLTRQCLTGVRIAGSTSVCALAR